MQVAKEIYPVTSGVRDSTQLEEWRRSLRASAAEARRNSDMRRRAFRAMLSVALVAAMVTITSVSIGVARHPDFLAIFGLAVRDLAKFALVSIWSFGGLLTWLAIRH